MITKLSLISYTYMCRTNMNFNTNKTIAKIFQLQKYLLNLK